MDAKANAERLRTKVPRAFAALLDVSENEVKELNAADLGADFLLSAVGNHFLIEFSSGSSSGSMVAHAQAAAKRAKRLRKEYTPVVAVPFMTEEGRRACENEKVSWFDLSGNGHLVAPGIRIIIEGRPNLFKPKGRPPNLFAPKSARVVRWLLMHPTETFTQLEIARATLMTEGYVSRVVAALEREGYVLRKRRGVVSTNDPILLLDAWREHYQFSKHRVIRGHVSARSSEALMRFTSEMLVMENVEHAATGLAAAWQLTHFATFRTLSFYLSAEPSDELKSKLGFREDSHGANLWLIAPNDGGVFQGAAEQDGVRCVHPVQAYVDLKAHPERAAEAAERLRSELMNWKRND